MPIDRALLDQLQQMASNLDETAAQPLSSALQEGAGPADQRSSNGTGQSSQAPAEKHETPVLTAAKIDAQEDFMEPPDPPPGMCHKICFSDLFMCFQSMLCI